MFHARPTSRTILRRRIIPNNAAYLLLVCHTILLEQVERVGLCGGLWVGLVEQRLDSEEDLFDSDGGLPAFFFVENGETYCAAGVDVGMEKRGDEFAWGCG